MMLAKCRRLQPLSCEPEAEYEHQSAVVAVQRTEDEVAGLDFDAQQFLNDGEYAGDNADHRVGWPRDYGRSVGRLTGQQIKCMKKDIYMRCNRLSSDVIRLSTTAPPHDINNEVKQSKYVTTNYDEPVST
uniref:Uncharacterized protein n=1 Tax=Plectus sambesii TaxID=2011161 RepID=A0A914XKK6_9BILA